MGEFIEGIKNIWKWRKVIWHDRDSDFQPLLEILHFKLENMEEHASFHSKNPRADEVARQVRKSKVILQKLKDGIYEDKAFEKHEEKWGKSRFYIDDETGKLEINKGNINTEKEAEQEREEFQQLMNKTGEHYYKMLAKALDNMKENLYNWFC